MGFFSFNTSHVWALATSQLTKTVSDKDENLSWSAGLHWHNYSNYKDYSQYSNCTRITTQLLSYLWHHRHVRLRMSQDIIRMAYMKCLPTFRPKQFKSGPLQSMRAFWRYFGMKYLWLEIQYSVFSIWPLSLENEAILKCNSCSWYFHSLLNVFLKIMGMALAVSKKKGCDNTLRCCCWRFFFFLIFWST